jgi:multidrug efflux pump subunit AcrA (membrane-fusion protein)
VRKWIVAGIVAVVVVVGSVVYFTSSGDSSSSKPLLITATAQARDLRDEVTVQGTLSRVEERTINSVSEASQVGKIYLDDGATLTAGERILALDGRDSVTAAGAFPFFRKLDVGAEGSDVLQLEQILKDAGYSPGTVDQLYTVQTSFALAQWQAAHGYPGATPQTSQTVNVALQQGTGYELGTQTSAGLTIGPPPVIKPAAAVGFTAPTGTRSAKVQILRGIARAIGARCR